MTVDGTRIVCVAVRGTDGVQTAYRRRGEMAVLAASRVTGSGAPRNVATRLLAFLVDDLRRLHQLTADGRDALVEEALERIDVRLHAVVLVAPPVVTPRGRDVGGVGREGLCRRGARRERPGRRGNGGARAHR